MGEDQCRRQPRRARGKHVIRRAAKSDYAHGNAPVHPANEWVQQEAGKSPANAEPVFRALQFRSHSQNAEMHSGDGRWSFRYVA